MILSHISKLEWEARCRAPFNHWPFDTGLHTFNYGNFRGGVDSIILFNIDCIIRSEARRHVKWFVVSSVPHRESYFMKWSHTLLRSILTSTNAIFCRYRVFVQKSTKEPWFWVASQFIFIIYVSLILKGLWLHLFVDSEAYHEQMGPIPSSNESLDKALSNAHT